MSSKARVSGITRRSLFRSLLLAAFLLAQPVVAAEQREAINRQRVDSSAIAAVGYDAAARVLEIEFRSGAIYRYLDVPEEIHRRLLAAGSKGGFFGKNIRDKFRSERVRSRTTK